MKKIFLSVQGDSIMAHWLDEHGGPDKATVDLFGTHIIPTAFTVLMPMSEAIAKIKALNPNSEVSA